jgi:hypothetical protein
LPVEVTVEVTEPVVGTIVLADEAADALLPTASAVPAIPASKTAPRTRLKILRRVLLIAMPGDSNRTA